MILLIAFPFRNRMKTILNIFYGILKAYCRLNDSPAQVAKDMKNFA